MIIWGLEVLMNLNKFFNKGRRNKGSVLDFIYVVILFGAFSIMLLVGSMISNAFNDEIQASSQFDATAKSNANKVVGQYNTTLDGGALLILMGLSIGMFVLASLVRVHPAFFVVYLFAFVFIIFVGGIFGEFYNELASQPEFQTEADGLVLTSTIMYWYPFVIGVIGTLFAIFMYKLWVNAQ